MVLSRPLITVDFINNITIESIDSKIESLKTSGLLNGSQEIAQDHALSVLHEEKGQLIMMTPECNFRPFDSVASLLEFMRGSPGYNDGREAEMVFKANVLKFYQNYHLAIALCETGTNYLESAPTISNNLYGKVLMFIRSYLTGADGDQKWSEKHRNKTERDSLSLLRMADGMNDDKIKRLYEAVLKQNLVEDSEKSKSKEDEEEEEGIHQKHFLSHHFQDANCNVQVTVMTNDFDVLTAPSALRLYGAIKLLLNGKSKAFAYKYLDPECPRERSYVEILDKDWLSRSTEIAFKVNLLRYFQNPNLLAILIDTGSNHLFCYTEPKWTDVTAQTHMILRHIFSGRGTDLLNLSDLE